VMNFSSMVFPLRVCVMSLGFRAREDPSRKTLPRSARLRIG
jgi:hypothetical protein